MTATITTAASGSGSAPTLAAGMEARLDAARARAAAGLRAGKNGVELCEGLTADVEGAVVDLAAAELDRARLGPTPGVAVLATGGFGRREFAPHSDLDLLFLCAAEPDDRIEALARAILHPIWGARLDAGHAVRSFDEALELPAADLTAATALLDARFLAGDRALADRFLVLTATRLAGAPQAFVARLRDEQRARHTRFGDTIFLLEPDVKSGPGGVRDLCAGRWAAQARFQTGRPDDLRALGEMSARQAAALEAARAGLLRLRVTMHLETGRRQDHLRFDVQERVAAVLHGGVRVSPGDIRPAVAPAVEALMRDFQRHARTVSRETERLLLIASANPRHVPRSRPVKVAPDALPDPAFELRDGALEVKDSQVFERRPAEMLRLFSVAIAVNAPVGLRTRDIVGELAAQRAVALREDPEVGARFFEVLCDVRDDATPSRLEQMQDLGLLAALMPEWDPVTGRVQHDIYHAYTVDQHLLYAVAQLKAVARGGHDREHPRLAEEWKLVRRREALFLGTLLHDAGKPLGRNHSVKGAVLAVAIGRRLGLGDEDVRRVEFLVREHLVMAHTSQRRDLAEPGTIERFAAACGDEEGLRDLFLLTFCDLLSTSPGNLTQWKDVLLHDLYDRTMTFLRRGPDLFMAERAELVRRRQREAARRLRQRLDAPELQRVFAGLPMRYFTENAAARVAAHVRLMRERSGPCALAVERQRKLACSEIVVVADDVPGLLAKIAGVFFANRVDVMSAAIYSRAPVFGDKVGEALDLFNVRCEPGGALVDDARAAAIRRDLESVLRGDTAIEALVASRPVAPSPYAPARPQVPRTEIHADNDMSRDFTVLDVFTEDRPGVLYTIARTLHEEGLDIQRSHIGGEADRIADIFYVRDSASGKKITDASRLETIREALRRALPSPDGA